MAGKVENCGQVRKWMPDAAVGSLPSDRRADFDLHLQGCARCDKEFRGMQTLLQAIDTGVSGSVAAEPSPQLIANIRQQIEHASAAPLWWRRSAWLTTACACAGVAIALLGVHALQRSYRAALNPQHQPVIASATAGNTAAPSNGSPVVEPARSAPLRNPTRATARRSSPRTFASVDSEPEVIVEPGQMQAILHFAAAMQRGQIDGAQFLADQKKTSEPLEIKPLTIAPLKIEPLDADAAPPASGSSEGSEKNFVAGSSD